MPNWTAKDVAEWMLEELRRDKMIYQENIRYGIAQKFGEEFVYQNRNGNLAISKDVLKEFRALTEGTSHVATLLPMLEVA